MWFVCVWMIILFFSIIGDGEKGDVNERRDYF